MDRDRVFAALGEPVRRRILELLTGGERSAGALVEALRATARISQPAVSQHLRVLREAGLIAVRAEGSRRYHALDPSGVEAARSWLAALTDPPVPFAPPLDAPATGVARGRRARGPAAAAEPRAAAPPERRRRA